MLYFLKLRKIKQDKQIDKIISFLFANVMKFKQNGLFKGGVFSTNFLENVRCLIYHSHKTDEIIGYANSFCNQKVRENKNQISAISHNLFGFDIFSF